MARSLKKGPFADASLLKKVEAMNASGAVSYTHLPFATPVFFAISLIDVFSIP